ncbi:MAG TPA: hypothetical protein VK421_05910 [Pyrinomonadaceae bacterium]|nr:hypothetical protein [Pyrinomonadaceae bacterium]
MVEFVSRLNGVRRRFLMPVALLFCLSASAFAELPPYVYKEQQAKSPERLTIKVKSVKTTERDEPDRKRVDVTVEARVTKVARTASRLRPGRTIRIRYTRSEYKQPIAGPSEVPLLREGETYPAFLSKSKEGNTYAPAAGGFSFRVVE